MGEVPYQVLPRPHPLLRFFAYKIRAREKVRKGEGEPGKRLSRAYKSCLLLATPIDLGHVLSAHECNSCIGQQ